NYEGTRGIPLLSNLFKEPAKKPPAPGEPQHSTEGAAEKSAPVPEQGSKLVPKSEPLPFRKVAATEGEGGEGGHGAEHGGEEKKPEHTGTEAEPAKEKEKEKKEAETEAQKPTEWAHKVEDLMGEGQYRRGRLFQFQRLEGGMSTDELNDILRRAQK